MGALSALYDELAAGAMASGGRLFDLAGASAASRARNLDRHWRNARALATHNSGVTKAAAIGGFEANGAKLPAKEVFQGAAGEPEFSGGFLV